MRRLGDLSCGRIVAAIWLAAVLDASMPVTARDLGVWGEIWPIEEPDLMERIGTLFEELEASGELARMDEDARRRAIERLESPDPVPGIAPATALRSWLHDPAVIVQQDFVAPGGIVLATAGTRIEPLKHRPMTQHLLFINGTRPVEVEWALAQVAPTRIVLLAGKPFDLARTHRRAFYFDQYGALTERFGLKATPARIRQEGLMLRIEEVALPDRAHELGSIPYEETK